MVKVKSKVVEVSVFNTCRQPSTALDLSNGVEASQRMLNAAKDGQTVPKASQR